MVKSEAVRRQVLALGNDNGTEVLLWGRHHPTRFELQVRRGPAPAECGRPGVQITCALGRRRPQAIQHADEAFYSMA